MNHNARVVWAKKKQVFNVAECYDVPWGMAKAYARRMKHDPRYIGGILLVLSMRYDSHEILSV